MGGAWHQASDAQEPVGLIDPGCALTTAQRLAPVD